MKEITREMLKIYKPLSSLDWLNYKIIRRQDLTYHHIVKKEHGGLATIENGALLIPTSHEYLHIIECRELEIYIALNKMFQIINRQGYEPTTEERQVIEILLREFEEMHKKDTNAKGKKLIRYKYLERNYDL